MKTIPELIELARKDAENDLANNVTALDRAMKSAEAKAEQIRSERFHSMSYRGIASGSGRGGETWDAEIQQQILAGRLESDLTDAVVEYAESIGEEIDWND